jgi:hypothetical protein
MVLLRGIQLRFFNGFNNCCFWQIIVVITPNIWFPRKLFFFTSDEIKIPAKFYPIFVEISMFQFPEISILISMYKSEFRLRFRFRLFTFDEIEIPTKLHTDFVKISTSKSEFRFRFPCRKVINSILIAYRNSDFEFPSKSKFLLLSIISTNNFVKSRNKLRSEFRSKLRRN